MKTFLFSRIQLIALRLSANKAKGKSPTSQARIMILGTRLVKAKREKYDGFYELNIHLAYSSYGKKHDQKASLST
jgi:hypothetical protein